MKNTLHEVIKIRRLTGQCFALRVERGDLTFLPGQHLNVGLPDDGQQREYSVYSSVHDDFLDILVQTISGGHVSPRLSQVAVGDPVLVSGPHGRFTLDPNAIGTTRFVLIATGTGIAPFHCFSQSYPALNCQILHGVRQPDQCYDKSDYPGHGYTACLSQSPDGDFQGRVTDYLKTHPMDVHAHYYLCGNADMIYEVFAILTAQHVPRHHICTEVYF
ncbi:MAG: oxidoreductase [Phycisphaerae bacterium]|nr:oxidoreductase [Phycisphaerae bacterium]